MQEKDKQLLKSSALNTADAIIAAINPGAAVAWGLAKALFGAGMSLRQDRALNFAEFIRDDPETFTTEILSTEQFQDGFVFILENFLRERSEVKREIMKKVFIGFTKAESKEQFPLEKYTHTLSQLTEEDIEALAKIDVTRDDPNYQIDDISGQYTNNLYDLISLGILHDRTNGRNYNVGKDAPFISATEFGKGFCTYLRS